MYESNLVYGSLSWRSSWGCLASPPHNTAAPCLDSGSQTFNWRKLESNLLQLLIFVLRLKYSVNKAVKMTIKIVLSLIEVYLESLNCFLQAGRSTAETNAVITTAVIADLPVLSSMLSRLFESSQHLNDVALHHLIDALCQLSRESMELAYTNREPSLFAVAKLLETGVYFSNNVKYFDISR